MPRPTPSSSPRFPLPTLLIPALLLAAGHACAHDDHLGEVHTEGVHEHGTAQLNVAVEGSLLLLELETPLMNLVGFEHAPRDDAERQVLAAAEAALGDTERLFVPDRAAGCVPLAAEVEVHTGAPDPAGGETHGDADASYRFECQHPAALRQVEVRLFAVFPGTTRLRVQVVGPTGQRGQDLTPDANLLAL